MFNGFDISTIQDAKFGNSQVSSIYYGANLIWPTTPPPHDYSRDYLTFESLEDNNIIRFKTTIYTFTKTISVSTDNGSTWTQYTSAVSTGTTLATLNTGDKLLVKGNNNIYCDYPNGDKCSFYSSKQCNISGNIMSLIYDDNFIGQISLSGKNMALAFIFSDFNNLISAEHLVLPATTLSESCYGNMFLNCGLLTTAPNILPATTLTLGCYASMFDDCTSLINAPELPATTLADYCYAYMFSGCTSLTTAPKLPATTLAESCYQAMFSNCNTLNYIKCLATDISANGCTTNWINAVYSTTGTFIKPSSTDWSIKTGTSGIPSGWAVINI